MPGVTTADVTQLLKEVYGPSVVNQLNDEIRALKHFERSESAQWLGEVFVESLHTGRNYSTKGAAEGGLLPNAGKQSYSELRIPDRYVYGTIEVTAQIMSEVKGKGAFANGLDREINGMIRDLKVECNRMMWGDGSGTLALVTSDIGGSPVSVIPVDTPGKVTGVINGARFLRVGMEVALFDAAPGSNTPNAVRTITAVAADGTDITVDATVINTDAPVNGVITKGVDIGGVLEGSFNLEPMGILGLVDDGTFVNVLHGLNRTNEPIFKSNRFSNVGSLEEIILHRALDTCDEIAGAEPDWYTCHHSVHREYIKISLPDKRYSGESLMRPDVGISGGGKKHELTFSGSGLEKERYCPYGTLYGIDSSACKRYVNVEGKWVDEDGAILHRGAGTTDTFKGTFRKFSNHGVLQSNSSFILDGINATIDVVNAN